MVVGQVHRAQQVGHGLGVGDRAPVADLALVHHVGPVGQVAGHVQGLLDQQHRRAPGGDLAHHRDQLGHQRRGQPQGQLVDQQQPGGHDQGLGQGQHLLLAAGQGGGAASQPLPEPGEQVERVGDAGVGGGPGHEVGEEAEVLLDGEPGGDGVAAHDLVQPHPHPPGGRGAGDVEAPEADAAGADRLEARDGPQGGGLARPVGPQQHRHLSLLHGEAGVEHRLNALVGHPHAVQLQQRPASAPNPPGRGGRPRPPVGAGGGRGGAAPGQPAADLDAGQRRHRDLHLMVAAGQRTGQQGGGNGGTRGESDDLAGGHNSPGGGAQPNPGSRVQAHRGQRERPGGHAPRDDQADVGEREGPQQRHQAADHHLEPGRGGPGCAPAPVEPVEPPAEDHRHCGPGGRRGQHTGRAPGGALPLAGEQGVAGGGHPREEGPDPEGGGDAAPGPGSVGNRDPPRTASTRQNRRG